MNQQQFYQFQQLVMAHLGLYDGACEGVWGPKSIKAKQEWELTSEYEPAIPTQGLPLSVGCKLPKGMRWIPGTNKLSVSFITEEQLAVLYKEHTLLTVSEIENPAPIKSKSSVSTKAETVAKTETTSDLGKE